LIVGVEDDVLQGLLGRRYGFWVGSFFLAYEFVLDSMGVLFLLGLIAALLRRYGLRTPHLTWKPLDLLLPAWLLLIGLSGFVVEGARLAAPALNSATHRSGRRSGISLPTYGKALARRTLAGGIAVSGCSMRPCHWVGLRYCRTGGRLSQS
jgi:hypothetical protein